MKKTTTSMKRVCVFAFSLLITGASFGSGNEKSTQFTGQKIENSERISFAKNLFKERFSNFELYQFNAGEISTFLASAGKSTSSCQLQLGDHNWTISVRENKIISEDFVMRGLTENGIVEYPADPNIHTYVGFSDGNTDQTVRLTTGKNTIIGMVNDHFGKYIIEPLTRYSSDASSSEFIVFRPEDVITPSVPCGTTVATSSSDASGAGKSNVSIQASAPPCHTIDVAMALDYPAYNKMGKPANLQIVQLEMLNVLNLINEIYTGMLSAPSPHAINYRLTEVFVEQTDANTFGSSMTNGGPAADAMLVKFAAWVNAGGFKKPYGLGTIWTSRGAYGNLNDLTFGFAINGLVMNPIPNVCHSNAVSNGLGAPHLLAKWAYFDSWGSAILAGHEMGHNWSAGHNGNAATPSNPGGSTDLMANGPSPGTWRLVTFEYNAFTAGITDAMNYGSCFRSCDAVAPIADFITSNGASSTASSCSGTVSFVNRSTGASSWVWNFGDGSPTSTEKDPIHIYTAKGNFTATLTATSGTQTVTKTSVVTVNNTTNTSPVTNVGIASTAGSGFPGGLVDKVMYFNVLAPALIKTVTIPVNMAGYITVEIYDNNMKAIFKKLVNVVSGDNKVTLNAELPTGTNYSMGLGKCSIGMVANRTNAGLAFPYTNSLISITKSNNDIHGGTSALIYYYFYNWEVQALTCLTDPTGGVGINNISETNDFLKLYPVPVNKQLNIEFQKNFQTCTIEIYDVLGALVLTNHFQNTGVKTLTLPINLANGTYLLKVNTGDNIHVQKLMVSE